MVYLPGYSSSNILFYLDNILNLQLKNDQCITSEISLIQPFLPLNRPILDYKQKTPRMWGIYSLIYQPSFSNIICSLAIGIKRPYTAPPNAPKPPCKILPNTIQ